MPLLERAMMELLAEEEADRAKADKGKGGKEAKKKQQKKKGKKEKEKKKAEPARVQYESDRDADADNVRALLSPLHSASHARPQLRTLLLAAVLCWHGACGASSQASSDSSMHVPSRQLALSQILRAHEQEAESSEPPAAEADEDGAADLLAAFARQNLGAATAATPAEALKQAKGKGKAKAAAAPPPQPEGGCPGVWPAGTAALMGAQSIA